MSTAEQMFMEMHKLQKQALQQAFIESLTQLQRDQLAIILSSMTITEATPYQASGADQASEFWSRVTAQKLPL